MAKKDKKYEVNEVSDSERGAAVPLPEPIREGEPDPTTPATKPGLNLVAKPQVHLKSVTEDGKQYNFTRFAMIKRAVKAPEGDIQVLIDGAPTPSWITSSKGWAATDASIDYLWFILPDAVGYITLDYGVAGLSMANYEFHLGQGKADRADPKRVPGKPETEEGRKQKFRENMAEKALAAGTPATTEQPTTEAAAEQ